MKNTRSTFVHSLLIGRLFGALLCGFCFNFVPGLAAVAAAETDAEDPVIAPEQVKPTAKFERGEYFFAPPAQQTALQLTYAQTPLYRTQTSTLPSGNYANDVTTSARSVSMFGQYSFTKNLSVSLNLQYRSDQNDYSSSAAALSTKSSGLADTGVGILYQLPSSFARYYFGFVGTFSTQKAVVATTTADGNEVSGGWTLRPSVGITKRFFTPDLRLGLDLAMKLRGDRTQDDNQSPENDITTTGGNAASLNLFAEYKLKPFLLTALHLSAERISAVNVTTPGASINIGTAEAYTSLSVDLEGDYYLYDWLTLKLGYGGTQLPARITNQIAGTTQVYISTLSGAARFVF